MLTHNDPEIREALEAATGIEWTLWHSGGGCMVLTTTLAHAGHEVWITREEDWLLGLYDFASDEEDEGVCVELMTTYDERDNPERVAAKVAELFRRFGEMFV